MSTATASNQEARRASSASQGTAMNRVLSQNWWLLALRGVLGIIFGVIAFLMPDVTILALVLVFSAYMLVDGIFAIVAAVRAVRRRERWGILLLQGLASLGTGILAFLWPGITILAFVLLIAAWSIVSGSLMLGAGFRIDTDHGRWWLVIGGFASLAFGILLILAPLVGAVVLTWWLGAFAIVLGVSLLVLAFKLRTQRHSDAPMGAAQPVT